MSRASDGFRGLLRSISPSLLAEYWIAFKNTAWEVFWGASILGIVFGIYTIFRTPTATVFLCYLLAVAFVAGYLLWRSDHVRLLPKFEIKQCRVQPSPNQPIGRSVWVQLELGCMTDAVVEECQGWLLAVRHRYQESSISGNEDWEETGINEPLALGWSISDSYEPATLHPGVPKRLNVFSFYSELPNPTMPQPSAKGVPLRYFEVLTRGGAFRFHVQVRAKDCEPRYVAIEYEPGEAWDKPRIRLIELSPKGEELNVSTGPVKPIQ